MLYSVNSGNIQAGVLYLVSGEQSVTYNDVIYSPGQKFRGVLNSATFTYSGTGVQLVVEVSELIGLSLEYAESLNEQPQFDESTLFRGMAVEYDLTDYEKIVNEITEIKGFALELIDYPFYSFEILETRL